MTVFLKSMACPVSKCILIGLCSADTVNRELFSVFFCVLLGCSFFQSVKVFLLFCVHLLHTFFIDSLFSATVYVGFASVFYWAGMGRECKISIQPVDVE